MPNMLHLTGPAVLNDGRYVDAGVDIEIGDGGGQIAPDRAKALLDGHGRAERPVDAKSKA